MRNARRYSEVQRRHICVLGFQQEFSSLSEVSFVQVIGREFWQYVGIGEEERVWRECRKLNVLFQIAQGSVV